ncbi:unnamed protein product, partial [Brachionus calyciflorus]
LVNSLFGHLSIISNDNQVVYKLINSGTLNENSDAAHDFRLDELTGNLYVANYLDREKNDSFTLYISASYRDKNFRSDHALVQIQIIDSDDNPPVFTRVSCLRSSCLFESNPCGQNGVCISIESSYVCVCDPDYTGRVCEINLKKSKCPEVNDESIDRKELEIFLKINYELSLSPGTQTISVSTVFPTPFLPRP